MNTVNVSFGDRVSICCERANSFLCSTGVADVRLHLSEGTTQGRPQLNFDRCIFSVEKVTSWGSATPSSPNPSSAPSDAAVSLAEPLMFGNVIQLKHIYSGHNVTVTRVRCHEAKGSLHVALEPTTSENYLASYFRVMPRYKIRQEGERVSAGDHLVLFNEYLKVHLSLDLKGVEVIGSSNLESFSLFVFDSAETRSTSFLRLQTSVLLFHKEQESFFQMELQGDTAVPSLVHPHIRDSTYNIAALDYSVNALWVLEGLQGSEGGPLVAHEAYRVKHCALGQYLSASLSCRDQIILVDQPMEGDATLWVFVPCDLTDRFIQTSNTFFRLQNAVTGCWLHTESPPAVPVPSEAITSKGSECVPTEPSVGALAARYSGHMTHAAPDRGESHINGFLSLVERPAYVDVFCGVTAPYIVERNLHRVLGYRSLLRQLRHAAATTSRNTLQGFVEDPLLPKVKVCLIELVPFCVNAVGSEGTSLQGASCPLPAQQRMLLDQNLHLIAIDTLEHLLRFEYEWTNHPNLMSIINAILRFLSVVVKENPIGCMAVGASINVLTPYLKHLPSSCDVFIQVSRVQALDSSLVAHIVNETIPLLSVHDAYFCLLQELCSGGGIPSQQNQQVIFDAVLVSQAAPKMSLTEGKLFVDCAALTNGTSRPIGVQMLEDSYSPELRYCAGSWKLLGCCTVGRPFPPLAWVEVDFVPQLLASVQHPILRQAVISVARSVFLADVDDIDQQHHQLWSWKYKMSEITNKSTAMCHISQVQEVIMNETISMLEPLSTRHETSAAECDLLNELLTLWNSITISQCYTPQHAQSLTSFVGTFMDHATVVGSMAPGGTESSSTNPEMADRVLQAVLHVLNLVEQLLGDHCAQGGKEIRHTVRPQLHEETDDNIEAIAAEVRAKSGSSLFCRQEWIPRLLQFASTKNPLVSSAALSCLFNILSPSRLTLMHIEASLVFSEGFERILGRILNVAKRAVGERFVLGRSSIHLEVLLTEVIDVAKELQHDITTTLDAQNVLHFVGLHSSICLYLEEAQRASVGHTLGNVVDLGMQLLCFMTERNVDIAVDMVSHLPTLTQLSTLCQSSPGYFTLMESIFGSAGKETVVDVTKLVHDIFASECLSEAPLRVVLQSLRCPSDVIRRNARDAAVSAMSVVAFDSIDDGCKSMILDILCECAGPETWDVLCRYIAVADVLSVMPSAQEFLAPTGTSLKEAFEVSIRCTALLFLREGAHVLPEEVELMKRTIVDAILEIATVTHQLQTLPPIAFECLARFMKLEGYRHLFLIPIRSIASHVLNHCETSVNTKFQLESKDELLQFFDAVEEFIKPDSIPNIAVVRRRLQRINKHADLADGGTSASSISGHWTKIRRALTANLKEPLEKDLQPLINLLKSGTYDAKDRLRMFVNHLRHSDLPSWVSVNLLLCMRYLLSEANENGERALVGMQDDLNSVGATPLLSILLEKPYFAVVRHAIKFGISLLENGNKNCQDTLLTYFKTHDEKFFLTIRRYLKLAHTEINSKSPSVDPDCELDEESFAAVSQDLCRLLQLLCEGHHYEFQNYVRHQNDNFNSYNMCVLVMELLHTVTVKMDPATLPIAIQALNTLTEFCQGPCQLNQATIVGCNIVAEVNRILTIQYDNDDFKDDMIMELKQAAIVVLLSLLEGSQDSSIPNLLLTHIDITALNMLVEQVWADAFQKGRDKSDSDELLGLGFNIFILAKILVSNGDKTKGDKLACILRDTAGYEYFNSSICNIEIWRDDDPSSLRLETVYFRKPEICRLREETKESVMNEVDRSSLVSKHSDFCKYADDLIFEMEFQFQIEESARHINRFIRYVTFNLATCRPRPVEDVLLLLSLLSNLMVIMGFTSRNGPTDWMASIIFFVMGILQFLCALYLVMVRMILKLPRLAHKALKKGETDAFLDLKTWREKFAHVSSFERICKVARETYTMAFSLFALASVLSVFTTPFYNTFLLGMVLFKAPLLANIVSAITMNGRQLLLTAFLGVISVYFFTVIGFLFFYEHFEREDGGSNCETLLQCFFYTFGQGVRGGGGIGDELKSNLWENKDFFRREMYDTLFFVMVAVIVMNIVFALIVDTFAELRDARKKIEDDMRTTCFVCGIDAATFDREGEGFGPHTKGPHNVWQYLYFLHHLRRKEVCEYTGQESYVAGKINKLDLSFFPVNRSKSLQKAHLASGDGNDDEGVLPGHAGPSGPSIDEIKKAVKEIVEDQVKVLKAAQTASGASGGSSEGNGSTRAPGNTLTNRASSLWAKARTSRSSLIRPNSSFRGGNTTHPTEGDDADDDAALSLAPSIQAVTRVRSTIASINELLDSSHRN